VTTGLSSTTYTYYDSVSGRWKGFSETRYYDSADGITWTENVPTAGIGSALGITDGAYDPSTGRVWVACQDASSPGGVVAAYSDDHGDNWVDVTPALVAEAGLDITGPAFVAVDGAGNTAVITSFEDRTGFQVQVFNGSTWGTQYSDTFGGGLYVSSIYYDSGIWSFTYTEGIGFPISIAAAYIHAGATIAGAGIIPTYDFDSPAGPLDSAVNAPYRAQAAGIVNGVPVAHFTDSASNNFILAWTSGIAAAPVSLAGVPSLNISANGGEQQFGPYPSGAVNALLYQGRIINPTAGTITDTSPILATEDMRWFANPVS